MKNGFRCFSVALIIISLICCGRMVDVVCLPFTMAGSIVTLSLYNQ